jgi:outer membrane receptor protein involved in Fe transport
MRHFRGTQIRNLLFTTTILGGLMAPGAVHAQAATDASATPPATTLAPATPQPETKGEDIVVTGSRIRRDNYNTASPVQIITHDEITLAGAGSTAEVLQGPSVTSGGAQINNTFLGYVTSGGPGANTVGLRGLGASRTLVLLNGRRLSPAGTESQVGTSDLNVLPLSMVDHFEILKDGASTIYGSDAIAGVVNIITKSDLDGLAFDGYGSLPTARGGGGQYRLSGSYGKVFDRGHFEVSLDYNVQTRLTRGDRNYAQCPTDDLYDPKTGAFVGSLGQDGKPRCLPFSYSGGQGIAQNYMVAYGFGGVHRFTPNASQVANAAGSVDGYTIVDSVGSRPAASPLQQNEDIYSPVKNLTFYGNGSFDLGGTHNAELYSEVLFSRRLSNQTGTTQLSANFADGVLPGYYPGYYDNPLFPKSLSNAGYYLANPLFILGNTKSKQTDNFFRANAGIRGDVGIKNWHFDTNVMYAKSWAMYSIQGTDTSRVVDSSNLVTAPAGTPSDLTIVAGNDRVLPGTYTCASNVSGGKYVAGGACVPIDWFSAATLSGNIPTNLKNWLLQDIVGHTQYEQITGEVNVDGDLFSVPAGAVGFSAGATIRHDKLNDVPSSQAQKGELYNYSSATITKGSDLVYELYGELNIPILKNMPFFQDLSAIASGRYTHYRSYGADTTYKVSGNWSPASFIRFRGSYGTSFRAPNLYEQNVGDQTGFYGAELDPCSDYQTGNLPSSNRYKNCLAALSPIVGSGNFNPNGGPEGISKGGKGLLKAETSTSLSYGMVLKPTFADFSFAVDYYRIKISNEVNQLGTDILNFCYDSTDFSTNFYCKLIAPRDKKTGNLTTFNNPFINVSKQSTSGIDFTLRYTHPLGQGKVLLDVQATRVLSQKYQQEPGGTTYDYVGTLGNADFAGGPKWTGLVDLRYKIKSWVFRYGVQYVGPMNSNALDEVDTSVDPYDLATGKYFEHGASIQYNANDGLEVTLGVKNFTNAKPEVISVGASVPRIGNYFNYSGYDFIGRQVFLEVVKKF